MEHLLIRITDFALVGLYALRIMFADGEEEIIDFEPVLYGQYFAPLRDPDLFAGVRLDPETHTLVWPNDAAFDPETLYNWHKGDGAALARKAARWKQIAVHPSND